jgi:ketosteroid isomerase-like protein
MRRSIAMCVLLWLPVALAADDKAAADKQAQVTKVLDDWHKAAAEAKEGAYFGHFTADAVFFGTDAKERWTRDEFRKYAKPFFDKGKAWTFKPKNRHISISKEGTIAWFDETLETSNLGPSRGTGVLVFDGKDWKIAQYHLCVPIPNEVFDPVKKIIAEAAKMK